MSGRSAAGDIYQHRVWRKQRGREESELQEQALKIAVEQAMRYGDWDAAVSLCEFGMAGHRMTVPNGSDPLGAGRGLLPDELRTPEREAGITPPGPLANAWRA